MTKMTSLLWFIFFTEVLLQWWRSDGCKDFWM